MDRKCDSDMGITQSRHSRRNVPMTLSQIAFAFGLHGGDFNTSTPRRLTDSPRCAAKMLSRSCIYVEHPERGGHDDHKIAGSDSLGV